MTARKPLIIKGELSAKALILKAGQKEVNDELGSLGHTMHLAPYKNFADLRLKKFCPDDDLYDEDVDEHGQFIKEEIRGAWFARWRKRPKELVLATITLNDCSTDIAPDFFAAIGLKLEPGLSRAETDARLGKPHWQRDGGDYVIYHTGGDYPYEVSCGFTDDMKLCQVTVRRLDIELPDDD